MAVIVLLLSLFVAAIWYAADRIIAEFPRYADDFRRLWEQTTDWASGWGLPISRPAWGQSGGSAPANGGQAVPDPITGFAIGQTE